MEPDAIEEGLPGAPPPPEAAAAIDNEVGAEVEEGAEEDVRGFGTEAFECRLECGSSIESVKEAGLTTISRTLRMFL